jgi:hypothetical protein
MNSCKNNNSKKKFENFDPNCVCAMNDYKFQENQKYYELNDDTVPQVINKTTTNQDPYKNDFDTYIAPYMKQNSNTNQNIVPVSTQVQNIPRNNNLYYGEQINLPSQVQSPMTDISTSVSCLICLCVVILIIYYIFSKK